MPKKTRKTRGLQFPFAGAENEALANEFLRSPQQFAQARGLRLSELECPPAAHRAMDRGKAFAAEAEAAGLKLDPASLQKLKRIAAKHFGKDCTAAMVPFGLKFRDKLVVTAGRESTATGSGTVTFLDTDADVDD